MDAQLASKVPLRLGDEWNAIRMLAYSQADPLKSIAEIVENSIDAGARNIQVLVRKIDGAHVLEVHDDGQGVPPDASGRPDMAAIPGRIGDSLKRRLADRTGIQGQFGIGILGFWAVASSYSLLSAGNGHVRRVTLRRDEPDAVVEDVSRGRLKQGSIVTLAGLNPDGVRVTNPTRLAAYLSNELRGRIIERGVSIVVQSGKVRERVRAVEHDGRPLPGLSTLAVPGGGYAKLQLFLLEPKASAQAKVALERGGRRIYENLGGRPDFQHEPWTSGRIAGSIDYEGLTIAPTRAEVVRDAIYVAFREALSETERCLLDFIKQDEAARKKAVSRKALADVGRVFKEVRPKLPDLEWFTMREEGGDLELTPPSPPLPIDPAAQPGVLDRLVIRPSVATVEVGHGRNLRVAAYDAAGTVLDPTTLDFQWATEKGHDPNVGGLLGASGPRLVFQAGVQEGKTIVGVQTTQGGVTRAAQSVIVVVPSVDPQTKDPRGRGLNLKYQSDLGSLRSLLRPIPFNQILINDTHADFLAAKQGKGRELVRYITRLVSKELILFNHMHFGNDPGRMMEELVGVLQAAEGRV